MTDRPKIDAAVEDLRLLEVANRLHNRGEVSDALRVKAAHTLLAEQQWVSVADSPENHGLRNKTVLYLHKSEVGDCDPYPELADEWRDEHHAAHATYWLNIYPLPAPPTGGN